MGLAILAILVSFQVVAFHLTNNYSSDDVAQQVILSQWQRGYPGQIVVGDDNWYLKFPLYWVMNLLPLSPGWRILLTTWLITLTTLAGAFLLLWGWLKYWLKPSPQVYVLAVIIGFLGLCSLAPAELATLAAVNIRNIEIPLFFLLIGCFFIPKSFSPRRQLIWGALSIVLLGALLADDPMFYYVGALPALGLLCLDLFAPQSFKAAAIKIAAILLGIGVAAAIKLGLVHFLHMSFIPHAGQFASFAQFLGNLGAISSTGLSMFGASIWGQSINITGLLALISLGLLITLFTIAWKLLRFGFRPSSPNVGVQLIALLPFLVIIVNAVASLGGIVRYLVLAPIALIAAAVVATALNVISMRLAGIIAATLALLAISVNVNAVTTVYAYRHNRPNIEDTALANTLVAHGLTKGFATYWRASSATYFSNYKSDVLVMKCSQRAQYDPFVSNTGILKKPATKTFIVYYPTPIIDQECTLPMLERQFGQPSQILSVPTGSGGKIAVYNRDITQEMLNP